MKKFNQSFYYIDRLKHIQECLVKRYDYKIILLLMESLTNPLTKKWVQDCNGLSKDEIENMGYVIRDEWCINEGGE